MLVRASDLMTSEFDRSSEESAYRRGFVHGVAETIRLVESKKSIDDLRDWMEGDLSVWRYSNQNGSMDLPPEIK